MGYSDGNVWFGDVGKGFCDFLFDGFEHFQSGYIKGIPVLDKLGFWFRYEVLSKPDSWGDGGTQRLGGSFSLHEKKDILFFVFINYVKQWLHDLYIKLISFFLDF